MRKLGRRPKMKCITDDDVLDVYSSWLAVKEGVISRNEAAEGLVERCGTSVPTAYDLFRRMTVIDILMNNNVDEAILEQIDVELNVLDIMRAGKYIIGR